MGWGGRIIDGFENACVGVESAEVVDIVGSREVVVTISDKFVEIGGLCRREREGCVTKVIESCNDVSESQMDDEKGRPPEPSDWREPTSSCSIRGKPGV